jgi:hypothetical protein
MVMPGDTGKIAPNMTAWGLPKKGRVMRLLPLAAMFIAVSTAASAAETWFPFKDPNGAFTVEVPGTPTVSTDSTNKTADGSVIPTTTYEVGGSPDVAIVISDFSKLQVDTGKAIDGGISAVKEDAVSIQLDQISVLDGQVGHEIAYIDKDGSHIDDRVYFFHGCLYQALALTTKDATTDQVAQGQRFLESFHFTPPKSSVSSESK